MKPLRKSLLSLLLLGTSVSATRFPSQIAPSFCKIVENTAREVMAARQAGVPQYEAASLAYRIDREGMEDSLVVDAYRQPVFQHDRDKKEIVLKFGRTYGAICRAMEIGLISEPSGMVTGMDLFRRDSFVSSDKPPRSS